MFCLVRDDLCVSDPAICRRDFPECRLKQLRFYAGSQTTGPVHLINILGTGSHWHAWRERHRKREGDLGRVRGAQRSVRKLKSRNGHPHLKIASKSPTQSYYQRVIRRHLTSYRITAAPNLVKKSGTILFLEIWANIWHQSKLDSSCWEGESKVNNQPLFKTTDE